MFDFLYRSLAGSPQKEPKPVSRRNCNSQARRPPSTVSAGVSNYAQAAGSASSKPSAPGAESRSKVGIPDASPKLAQPSSVHFNVGSDSIAAPPPEKVAPSSPPPPLPPPRVPTPSTRVISTSKSSVKPNQIPNSIAESRGTERHRIEELEKRHSSIQESSNQLRNRITEMEKQIGKALLEKVEVMNRADRSEALVERLRNDLVTSKGMVAQIEHRSSKQTMIDQARIKELENELLNEERAKRTAQRALAKAMEDLSTHDVGDLNQAIESLGDLNDSIDEFAFDLYNDVPSVVRSVPLSVQLVQQVVQHHLSSPFPGVRNLVRRLVELSHQGHRMSLEFVLVPLFRCFLVEALYHDVLAKFHYASSIEASSLVKALYKILYYKSTQQQAARWRLATFQALSDATNGISPDTLVSSFVDSVVMSVGPMCVTMKMQIDESKLAEWRLRLSKIFLGGVEFQFLTAEKYLSCDLKILIGRNEIENSAAPYDKNLMREGAEVTKKALGGPVEPTVQTKDSNLTVLAATSFGLLSFRRETSASGALKTNRKILLRSEVVLSNWLEKDEEKERQDRALKAGEAKGKAEKKGDEARVAGLTEVKVKVKAEKKDDEARVAIVETAVQESEVNKVARVEKVEKVEKVDDGEVAEKEDVAEVSEKEGNKKRKRRQEVCVAREGTDDEVKPGEHRGSRKASGDQPRVRDAGISNL